VPSFRMPLKSLPSPLSIAGPLIAGESFPDGAGMQEVDADALVLSQPYLQGTLFRIPAQLGIGAPAGPAAGLPGLASLAALT
jgi:hypothetical protein